MEVQLKRQPWVVRRCYQRCRQQAELLVLAYEQVCPQARRVLFRREAGEKTTADRRGATRRA